MKNNFLQLLLFLLPVFALNAQKMEMGIKAGYNLADLNGREIYDEFKHGFAAGVFAEIRVSDKIAFQPELLFSQQGGKSNRFTDFGADVANNGLTQGNISLDYLNLPLILKYYAKGSFFVEGGPLIGVLLNSEYIRKTDSRLQPDDLTPFLERSQNDLEFGFNAGMGYKFDCGLHLSARYYLGLSEITSGDVQFQLQNLKNSVYQFLLGYSF